MLILREILDQRIKKIDQPAACVRILRKIVFFPRMFIIFPPLLPRKHCTTGLLLAKLANQWLYTTLRALKNYGSYMWLRVGLQCWIMKKHKFSWTPCSFWTCNQESTCCFKLWIHLVVIASGFLVDIRLDTRRMISSTFFKKKADYRKTSTVSV